jgi:hypothetical protein
MADKLFRDTLAQVEDSSSKTSHLSHQVEESFSSSPNKSLWSQLMLRLMEVLECKEEEGVQEELFLLTSSRFFCLTVIAFQPKEVSVVVLEEGEE